MSKPFALFLLLASFCLSGAQAQFSAFVQGKSGFTTTVTWNPSDSGGGTFSNGNLTITGATGGGGSWFVTRTTSSYSSGKYYLETTINTALNDGSYGSWAIGVANGSQSLTNYLGSTNTTGIGWYSNNGNTLGCSTSGGCNIETGTVGNTVQVAYDFGNELMWISVNNGGWNVGATGTQNPATGAGGIGISTITGPYYPAWNYQNSATNAGALTTNFGASGFTYTPPSGFQGFTH